MKGKGERMANKQDKMEGGAQKRNGKKKAGREQGSGSYRKRERQGQR